MTDGSDPEDAVRSATPLPYSSSQERRPVALRPTLSVWFAVSWLLFNYCFLNIAISVPLILSFYFFYDRSLPCLENFQGKTGYEKNCRFFKMKKCVKFINVLLRYVK